MQNFRLFGTLAKVEDQEDGTIKVYGIASSGNKDAAGEVVQPDAMKAALPDYSRYPALREMHQPSAAGKVLEASVNDNGETDIIAHVVDPIAVQKVKTGVYAGFSIGGKVTKRDATDKSVITGLRLVEISLVDSPCNPDCALTMWKADIDMATEFKPSSADVIARAKTLAKAAGTQRFKEFLFEASQELQAEHELEKGEITEPVAEPAAEAEVDVNAELREVAAEVAAEEPAAVVEQTVEAAAAAEVVAPPEDDEEDGENNDGGEDRANDDQRIAAAADAEAITDPAAALEAALDAALEKAAKEPYGSVEYADPGYQDDKKKRYPLDTEEHIRAAWNYIHKASNRDKYSADQVSKIEAKIVAAWKSKIDDKGPPSAEKTALVADLEKTAVALAAIGVDVSKLSDDAVANQASADALGITKSLYSVSCMASALQQLASLQSCITMEEEYEGDTSSAVPTQLAAQVRALGATLVTYAQEEVAELVEQLTGAGDAVEIVYVGEDCEYAQSIVDLTKADEELMAKAGARNSKSDKGLLQGAHDNLAKMGALCDKGNCGEDAEMAAGAEQLATLTGENERLNKLISESLPKVEELIEKLASTETEVAELRKRFNDEPLPAKTAGPGSVVVIGKAADSTGNGGEGTEQGAIPAMTDEQLQKWWDSLPPQERGEIQVKIALRHPQALVPRT